MKDIKLEGEALDEFLAIQEAELGQEPEIASDAEIKVLMRELWEEFVPTTNEDTEQDAFSDFMADLQEDWN